MAKHTLRSLVAYHAGQAARANSMTRESARQASQQYVETASLTAFWAGYFGRDLN